MRIGACLALALAACSPSATIGYVMDDAGLVTDATTPALVTIDECQGGALPADVVDTLHSSAEEGGRWLYPYDQTVLPRGVGAPKFMWDGSVAEAVLVRVRARALSYEGCFRPDADGSLSLSDATWQRIESATAGKDDPLTITLTTTSQGRVIALPARTLVIASEPLVGSLFYMAYGSRAAPLSATGSVFQLPLGGSATVAVTSLSCAGCHALSADGTRMLAYADGLDHAYTRSAQGFALSPTGGSNGELSALTPDGRFSVSSSRSSGIGPRFYGPATVQDATLFDLTSGLALSNSALPAGALMPAFSPQGDTLVFTDAALGGGRGIAVMTFDPVALRFAGYRTLLQDATRFPGWPSFLPSQEAVVFAFGTQSDYSGSGALLLQGTGAGPASDLFAASLHAEPGVPPTLLHQAMGFASAEAAASQQTYLPFGSEELHQNYNPQVAPQAAGGFHWVFFDSIRHYGSLGLRRRIWCAAIDDDDPTQSHPAFYLRGQDADVSTFRPIFAGNVR